LAANPTNLITWGVLAADVASLILPGVTGGGGIIRFVASADDLVDAARYVDDVIDTSKAIRSTAGRGRALHNLYAPIAESTTGYINRSLGTIFDSVTSRLRPDAVDLANDIIYELKPLNKKAFLQAISQTQNYIDNIPNGKKFTVIIDMYY